MKRELTPEQKVAAAKRSREYRERQVAAPAPELPAERLDCPGCERLGTLLARALEVISCMTVRDGLHHANVTVHDVMQPIDAAHDAPLGPPAPARAPAETLVSNSFSSQRNTENSSSQAQTFQDSNGAGETRDAHDAASRVMRDARDVTQTASDGTDRRHQQAFAGGRILELSETEKSGDPEAWATDPALARARKRGTGGPTRIGGIR